MNTNQSPPTKFPMNIWKNPMTIRKRAKPLPMLLATFVALLRSPVLIHQRALKTLPPSSGKPGIMLNARRMKFMSARYPSTDFKSGNAGVLEREISVGKRPREEHEDNEPCIIKGYLYPEHPEELYSFCHVKASCLRFSLAIRAFEGP